MCDILRIRYLIPKSFKGGGIISLTLTKKNTQKKKTILLSLGEKLTQKKQKYQAGYSQTYLSTDFPLENISS